MQINGRIIITAVDVPLSLKKPPGYVAITLVIIIKNIIKKILPYLEKDENLSSAFLEEPKFS
jgi:hypothetical protein